MGVSDSWMCARVCMYVYMYYADIIRCRVYRVGWLATMHDLYSEKEKRNKGVMRFRLARLLTRTMMQLLLGCFLRK